jgi:hypothetical protein
MNNLINHTFLVYQSQTFPTMFQKLKSMILVPMLIVFGTFMSVAQTYNAVSSAVCPTFNRTCSGYAYEGNAICIKLSSINGNTLNLSVYKTTGQAFTTAGNMLLMENDPCGNFIAEGRYSTSTMSKTLSTTLSFTSGLKHVLGQVHFSLKHKRVEWRRHCHLPHQMAVRFLTIHQASR